MKSSAIVNPAGGVRYHLRALRYSRSHWESFRWELGEWLLNWTPPESTLVLVGPSAGYCMQPFFFERFERVVCLEPDPTARFLFRRKLHRAPLEHRPVVEFVATDHLVHTPELFPRLLEQTPDACVLFSNVIGQLRVLLQVDRTDAPELVRVREAVHEGIAKRSWASFHDRVSGYLRPSIDSAQMAQSRLSDDEVLDLLYGESRPTRRRQARELVDHLTDGFFPSHLPHTYFNWELEPGRIHLIEGVRSVANTSA